MADRVVDRLVVAVSYAVDKASANAARSFSMGWLGKISAAVTAGTVALGAYTVASASALDAIVKQGRAMSMTAEEYSRWLFVAERSGVEVGTFREGMNQLTGRLRAAAAGSKEAAAPFKALGVSLKNADRSFKTAAQILPELADGLNGITDEGKRAILTIGVLGEGGSKLRSLLDLGSEGIRGMGDEAQRLGGVLSNDAGAAAENLTDAVTDLKTAAGGLGRGLAVGLMPTLSLLTRRLTAVLTDSDGIVRVGLDRAVRAISHAFTALERPAGQALFVLTAIGGLFYGASATMGVPMLGGVSKGIVGIGTALKGAAMGAAALLGLPFSVFIGFVAAAAATVGLLYLAWDEFRVTAAGGDSVIRRVADSLGVGTETAQAFAGSMAVLTGLLANGTRIAVGLAEGIGAIGSGIVSMVSTALPYIEALIGGMYTLVGAMPKGLGTLLSGIGDAMPTELGGGAVSTVGGALQGFGGALQGGPREALRGTLSTFGSVGQSVGGGLQQMNNTASQTGPSTTTINQPISVSVDGSAASSPDAIALAIVREVRRSNAAMEGM